MRLLNQSNMLPEELSLEANKLGTLIALVSDGKINRGAYKKTIEAVFTDNVDPEAYIAQNGLLTKNDDGIILEAVTVVINENPNAVAEYQAGKEKAFGFLMGQAMRRLGGSGNPALVRKALSKELGELRESKN